MKETVQVTRHGVESLEVAKRTKINISGYLITRSVIERRRM